MKKGIGPRNLGAPKGVGKMYGAKSPAKQATTSEKFMSRWSGGPQVDDTPEGRGQATRTIDKAKSAIQAPFSDKTYEDFKKEYRTGQKQKHAGQVEKRRDWLNYWTKKM
jgi:hypothetical protein